MIGGSDLVGGEHLLDHPVIALVAVQRLDDPVAPAPHEAAGCFGRHCPCASHTSRCSARHPSSACPNVRRNAYPREGGRQLLHKPWENGRPKSDCSLPKWAELRSNPDRLCVEVSARSASGNADSFRLSSSSATKASIGFRIQFTPLTVGTVGRTGSSERPVIRQRRSLCGRPWQP